MLYQSTEKWAKIIHHPPQKLSIILLSLTQPYQYVGMGFCFFFSSYIEFF